MGDRILANRYSLESEIGRGGMGVVYKATDTEVKRTVAVKTLPAVMSHNEDLMRRFTSEVQHASKLEHPNIVRVYDVGEDEGTHFYVMQYIDGSDLRSWMKSKGRYSVDDTISIISQVADALDYAHSQGIVHRDIKPENILLDSYGNAHVADFGIAKATEGTRTTRGMLGTPEYMSPEQVKGKSVDGRSDQYSLAVVAYEMLTGRTPFKTEGDDPWAQINMHLNTPVPNPRTTVPDIPAHLANALLQALAKRPEQRFDSCSEFVRALKGEIEAVVRQGLNKPRRLLTTLGGLTAVMLLAMIAAITIGHRPSIDTSTSSLPSNLKTVSQLYYVDNSREVPVLCAVTENGARRAELLRLPVGFTFLRVSNDGSRVFWVNKNSMSTWSRDKGTTSGGSLASPSKNASCRVLDVSHDLSHVLYMVEPGKQGALDGTIADARTMTLYQSDLNGSGLRRLYSGRLNGASYCADGDHILIYVNKTSMFDRGPVQDVILLSLLSGKVAMLGSGPGNYTCYATSDQSAVLFVNEGSAALLDYDGHVMARFTSNDGNIQSACFVPGDQSILFADNRAVWLVQRDGTQARKLLDSWWKDYMNPFVNLSVSGDAKFAVFQTNDTESPARVGWIDLRSGRSLDLVNESTGGAFASFSPDNEHLALLKFDGANSGALAVTRSGEQALRSIASGSISDVHWIDGLWMSGLEKQSKMRGKDQQHVPSPALPKGFATFGRRLTADFDGDGSAENSLCAEKDERAWVVVYGNTGTTVCSRDIDLSYSETGPNRVTFFGAMDATGDGRPEICLIAGSDGHCSVHLFSVSRGKLVDLTPDVSSYYGTAAVPFIKEAGKGRPVTLAIDTGWGNDSDNGFHILTWNGSRFVHSGNIDLDRSADSEESVVSAMQQKGYRVLGQVR